MLNAIQFVASAEATQQAIRSADSTGKKRPTVRDKHGTAVQVWMGHPSERPEGWAQGDLPH